MKNYNSEHNFQKVVVQYLRAHEFLVINSDVMDGLKFLANDTNKRMCFISEHKQRGYTKGQPDIIAVSKDGVWFIELKTESGRQSPEQKQWQQVLTAWGHNYIVVRSIQELETMLHQ